MKAICALAVCFFLLAGCAKPRKYVLSARKVYTIVEDVWVVVEVDDKELGKSVAVEYKFAAGSKITLGGNN